MACDGGARPEEGDHAVVVGIGTNRLKRVLGCVVGVGYCARFSTSGEKTSGGRKAEKPSRVGHKDGDNDVSALDFMLRAVSRCCAAVAWCPGSSLYNNSGVTAATVLDPLDASLERYHGVELTRSELRNDGGQQSRRHCSGLCADLFSSVGMRAAPAAREHCMCRLLSIVGTRGMKMQNNHKWGGFADDCAAFLFDCSLPLRTR